MRRFSCSVVCLRALEDFPVVPPTTRIALGRCSLSTREGALRSYVTPNNATFIYVMEETDLASGLLDVSHAQIVEFERTTIPEFKKVFWVRLLLGGTA